jgi:dolichol-phosphate mannosyltransferase
MGARITELPICFVDRRVGESKMSAAIVAEALALVTGWGLTRRLSRLARPTQAAREARRCRPPTVGEAVLTKAESPPSAR